MMRMKTTLLGLGLLFSVAAALGSAIVGVKPVAQFVTLQDSEKKIDRGKGPDSPEFSVAGHLSAMELTIGVKAEQLNAWRDYTSALLALLAPEPPKNPNINHHDNDDATHQAKDPFDREGKLADHILKRAVAAQKLKDAIETLRTALGADQLRLLATFDEQGPHIPRDAFDKVRDKSDEGKDEPEH